jgi:hypothetical protein
MANKSLFSNLLSKLPGMQKETPKLPPWEKPNLKLIFFILDWQNANVVSEVLQNEKARFHFISKGRGTAASDVLDLLGIGTSDKAIVLCLEQAILVPILLKDVRSRLKHTNPGAGIAFTIPLSAINDPILLIFKQSILKNEKITTQIENKGAAMTFTHDLIISILNHGFSDDFMDTARAAGATGGTVINARGQAHGGAAQFLGVSMHEEREIILILAQSEKKVAIMQAISEKHGLNTDAQGIIFSMPVDSVLGLSLE